MRSSGLVLGYSRPALAASSIFREDATSLAVASSQVYAKKFANQLMYGIPVVTGGAFYGYSGMGYGGQPGEYKNTGVKFQTNNSPLWVVGPNQPRKKVTLVYETTGQEEEERGASKNQEELEHVPIPNPSLVRHYGRLGSYGPDQWAAIWCPATDEYWEFHQLRRFVTGPKAGQWKCGAGHYQANVSQWSGICAPSTGVGNATGLMWAAGQITIQDVVNILRGGKIAHALGTCGIVTSNGHVAPAPQGDAKPNPAPFLEDGTTPNPAYTTLGPEIPGAPEGEWKEGWADAVPEGSWFRFPPASRPGEYGMTSAIQVAIYEAIREHGLVLQIRGGNCEIVFTDPMTLFTPYCDSTINPFNGSPGWASYVNAETTEAQRAGWIDGTLPTLWTPQVNGPAGILTPMPWRTLELLEPRAS
jgi:hypothetical protein